MTPGVVPGGDKNMEMNMTTKKPNRPPHAVWQVNGEGEKARWNRIGSAWVHEDTKGLNMRLDSLPLTGRIVVRAIPDTVAADDADQGGQP